MEPKDIYDEICDSDVLIRENDLDNQILNMSCEIEDIFHTSKELFVLSILKGGFRLTSEIMKWVDIPMIIDFIKVSSYDGGFKSSELNIGNLPYIPNDSDILIVDDILDTGRTFDSVVNLITKNYTTKKILGCFVVQKQERENILSCIKYNGDGFLVGYGMDYKEGYGRDLNNIYIM